MKTDELKLRVVTYAENLIDQYIPSINFLERIKNTTAKYWLNQNVGKLDTILNIFADSDNNIDVKKIRDYYEPTLFENGEFKVDIKSIIPDDQQVLKQMLPDSIIIFTKDDLNEIFGQEK